MSKTLYKAKIKDKLPLGGIATGHLDLGYDGSISGSACPVFVIKAEKEGELYDARILQSTASESVPMPCFEKSESFSYFPFSEIMFSDSSFAADVKMIAFSPFIPLNDTDSGIPGVLFEFEVTNKTDEKTDFTIGGILKNENICSFNRMGCTDTGEAYIFLCGNDEDSENTCIATNGKNISFCEYIPSYEHFIKNFTCNTTLVNGTKCECENNTAFGSLCTHFSLNSGETASVSFCVSWYKPYNGFSRNYYAQYFESSLECASYLFRQRERLALDSMKLCENVSGATLPENVIDCANAELLSLVAKDYIRIDNGALIADDTAFSDLESFVSRQDALCNLFPALENSSVLNFFRSESYNDADDEKLCLVILRCYRKFILTANVDELIEEWYFIVKCAEIVFGEDGHKVSSLRENLANAVIKALCDMAEAVRDKKRHELYSSLLSDYPCTQAPIDIVGGFSKIYEMSGFEYRADTKHIGFCPKSDECPLDMGETFRCFFCTPQAYGYVEEGIDYIEINLLNGSLDIKSFGVPRTPRLVRYGGRNWRFNDTGKCALLDSELEVTPQKKLTIFIDIKSN